MTPHTGARGTKKSWAVTLKNVRRPPPLSPCYLPIANLSHIFLWRDLRRPFYRNISLINRSRRRRRRLASRGLRLLFRRSLVSPLTGFNLWIRALPPFTSSPPFPKAKRNFLASKIIQRGTLITQQPSNEVFITEKASKMALKSRRRRRRDVDTL